MIRLQNITLRRGSKVLLDKVNVTLQPGEKIGLVGQNGAGKSSLFSLFTGRLHEDAGELQFPNQWDKSEVAQHMPETDESATDYVLAGDVKLQAAQAALALLEAMTGADAETIAHAEELGHAHALLADLGAFDAPARAQALILGLGFKVAELGQSVNSFSGGWRMRLQLARALMCPSDLLLMDEPTNHLDLDALVWLEAWLKRYQGMLIVISHDREFLDSVTNVTIHLEQAKLTRYGGNYSTFEDLRSQALALQQGAFAKQQDKIEHLQKFIARFKAKASKAKQAQSRVKALERMERVAPIITSADFSFEFKKPLALPNPMLKMVDAAFGYIDAASGTKKTILTGVNRSVTAGERIGILGANGQGKSTLVKTIAQTMPSLAGSLSQGKGLSIGYFAQQELDVLRPDSSPLEHMIRLARDLTPQGAAQPREQDLRNFLGQFRFMGDMVTQQVGTLSGGEKARLVLALIMWQRPNLLLLDEPTNHLDLTTREALAFALNDFEGTVMLVSHDRSLLRSVCDTFWLVAEGVVKDFTGDLDDYQKYLLDLSKQNAKTAAQAAKMAAQPKTASVSIAAPAVSASLPVKKKNQAFVKQKIDTLEQKIDSLSREKTTIETQLAGTPSLGDIEHLSARLTLAALELQMAEDQWLEAQTQLA